MDDQVIVERDGAVATLVLNRPEKRNPIGFDTWSRLPGLLEGLAGDAAVRVLVVRGAGDQAFSAGADLGELEDYRGDPDRARAYHEAVDAAGRALAGFPKPTIARIHGPCVGGGADLALACDFRFADTNARFGVPPARLGLVFGLSATRRLTDLAGPAVARWLLFSGEHLDARRAFEVGLFDRLETPAELHAATRAFAELLSDRSPYSIRAAKEILRRVADGQRDDDGATRALRDDAFAGPDFEEGVRAFREKRSPRFA